MAITINVYPNLSPRIIEIQAPTTNASVQEIVNACREWEDSEIGMYYPFLIDAAGKEDLGGGVRVGITATLQNAQIAFEAQSGSDSAGSVTTLDATGKILIDSTATFITDGIQPGDTVLNTTDGSITTVLSVDSETQLTTFGLADGVDNQFASSDNYKIWNKVQCEVSGGNLVAVDDLGASISSFLPTAQTHVVRTSSSSATLQEQDAIQYSSYGGGVSLDITSPYSGTVYPVGNQEYPVNNIVDAVAIANQKGFDIIYIKSSMTGVNKINSGTNLSGFTLIGQSQSNTHLEIDASADTTGIVIRKATVYGTLDGDTTLEDCFVGTINYFNGFIHECGLFGTIYLEGDVEAVIEDCYTMNQDSPAIIDMGGSGQDLAMPNYSGLVHIENLTSATEEVGIGLLAGMVILQSSVTAGIFIISGVGIVQDDSTSVTLLNTDGLVNGAIVADAVWNETMSEHTTSGSTGETLDTAKKKANLSASLSA